MHARTRTTWSSKLRMPENYPWWPIPYETRNSRQNRREKEIESNVHHLPIFKVRRKPDLLLAMDEEHCDGQRRKGWWSEAREAETERGWSDSWTFPGEGNTLNSLCDPATHGIHASIRGTPCASSFFFQTPNWVYLFALGNKRSLLIKSDHVRAHREVHGTTIIERTIPKLEDAPESFRLLVRELRSLDQEPNHFFVFEKNFQINMNKI